MTDMTNGKDASFMIFGCRRAPGQTDAYVVIDALEREHHVWGEHALGLLIAKLHDDDQLPRSKVDRPQNEVVGLVGRIARRFMPEYADLIGSAEPLAHHATETLSKLSKISKDAKARASANGKKTKNGRGPRPSKRVREREG